MTDTYRGDAEGWPEGSIDPADLPKCQCGRRVGPWWGIDGSLRWQCCRPVTAAAREALILLWRTKGGEPCGQ